MNNSDTNMFVYLLIDNGLLNAVSENYTEADSKSQPTWLMPVYAGPALAVSPLLVDVEAAYEAGDLDRVMRYLNARTPALHVSILETGADLAEIAQHLRRFIFILDPEGKQFTLRYADCAVLEPLSSVLTAVQWATMKGPIKRWHIHDRSGVLIQLPAVELSAIEPTPLCLDDDQLAALDEISEPDHCIAKVNMMRNGAALPGNPADQHAWARAARLTWHAAKNSNPLMLMFLTEAALLTRGEILDRQEIQDFLAMDEVSAFRNKLQGLANDSEERQNRLSQIVDRNEKSGLDTSFI